MSKSAITALLYLERTLSVRSQSTSFSRAPYNVHDAPLELGDGPQRPLAEVWRPPRPLQQESQGSHCRDLDEGGTRETAEGSRAHSAWVRRAWDYFSFREARTLSLVDSRIMFLFIFG